MSVQHLTTLQADVLAILTAVYPSMLTTNETAERRTGRAYDRQETYRALRQLEAKGRVVGYRVSRSESVAWSATGPSESTSP